MTEPSQGVSEKNDKKTYIAEKRRQELWLYLGVGIISIEALVTVAALCYGFITAKPDAGGGLQTNFPFLLWGAGMIMLPSALIAAVHYAGVGLFSSTKKSVEEAEWEAALPERLQRVYRLLKGAPALVVLLALIFIGATLATIDGALSALSRTASAFIPYIPHIVGGLALMVCCVCMSAAWLRYKSRKLEAEYAFRREVFERSGIVIVDKKSYALPSSADSEPLVLDASAQDVRPALPEADSSQKKTINQS